MHLLSPTCIHDYSARENLSTKAQKLPSTQDAWQNTRGSGMAVGTGSHRQRSASNRSPEVRYFFPSTPPNTYNTPAHATAVANFRGCAISPMISHVPDAGSKPI